MPTYDYACTDCEHRFEIVQSFVDDSLTECPQCDGRLRKVFNAVGVVFKGSGFYRTDSRNDMRRGSGSASSSQSTSNRSSSESSSTSTSSSSSSDSSSSGATKTASKSESTKTPATTSSKA